MLKSLICKFWGHDWDEKMCRGFTGVNSYYLQRNCKRCGLVNARLVDIDGSISR